MRKIITILIMLIAAAFTASAAIYQVKYVDEFGITERAQYTAFETLDRDINNWNVSGLRQSYYYDEIIDEDSNAIDLAIVNKLDKQGYIHAMRKGWDVQYLKINDQWHKFYKHK